MGSMAAGLCVVTGLLALLIFVVFGTARFNQNRRMEKITARLLNLK